jgi:hypothetical protein
MREMDQVSATLSKQDPGHHQARTNLGKESWWRCCGRMKDFPERHWGKSSMLTHLRSNSLHTATRERSTMRRKPALLRAFVLPVAMSDTEGDAATVRPW